MIDSHAHINESVLNNPDDIVKLINELDYLDYVINVGLNLETSKYAVDLGNKEEKFYSVIGIHPLYEGKIEDIYDLYKKSDTRKIVGIGETGIDISENLVDSRYSLINQIRKFHESIALANELGLPLVIHSNHSNSDCLNIIKKHIPKYGFIFHCFEPNLEVMDSIIKLGGYISIGTPITKKSAKKSLEVIKNVYIKRLLIELDYPFMSDDPINNGREVFRKIADIRNINYDELEKTLDENTKRLFRKVGN